jgi:hypothetical protein
VGAIRQRFAPTRPWRHLRSALPRERNRSLFRSSPELDTSRTSGLGYEHRFHPRAKIHGWFQMRPGSRFGFGSVALTHRQTVV